VEALVQANKREPVIIGEDNMVIGELIYGGYLLNLTPYMNELLSNVSLIPSMKSIVEYETQVFHAIYFVPLRANVPLVFYNATLFKKLGISPPPELERAALRRRADIQQDWH
jgi:trehalose transport system substrate-binding protein